MKKIFITVDAKKISLHHLYKDIAHLVMTSFPKSTQGQKCVVHLVLKNIYSIVISES